MSTQLRRHVFRASRLPERALERDPDITALNSDWNGITRLPISIAPLTCDICGAVPCINPSFCRLCREVDRHPTRKRVAALKQPETRARLHNCDAAARAEIKQWLAAKFQKED
jgi:hypothetical protein